MNDAGGCKLCHGYIARAKLFISGLTFPKFKITLAILRKRNKRESGAVPQIDNQSAGINRCAFEFTAEKTAERIVADFTDERGTSAQTGDTNRHIGRGAAGRFPELRGFGNRGRFRRDEIHDQLTNACYIKPADVHCGIPRSLTVMV